MPALEPRAETVMLPYTAIPGIDLMSKAYLKAEEYIRKAAETVIAANRKRQRRNSTDAFGDSQYQVACQSSYIYSYMALSILTDLYF